MKKRLLMALCTVVTVSLLATGCGGKKDEKKTADKPAGSASQVYFATGTPGGVYQILGAGMAKIINEKNIGVEIVPTTPAQMQQAPSMLQQGQAKISIGMLCMFERAYNGQEEYKGKAHPKLRQVLGMYDNIFAYLTLKNNDKINGLKDLQNSNFASTATNVVLVKKVVAAAGGDPNKIKIRTMSYQQSIDALSDGTSDATVLTAFPKNGGLDSLASTKGVKFLNMDAATRAKFDKENPYWKTSAVPGGTYPGIPDAAWAPTIYTALYVSDDMPEDLVYNITKTIIENANEIAKIYPAGKDMTLETTKRYLDNGLMSVDRMHPGAVKYFKEKGVIK